MKIFTKNHAKRGYKDFLKTIENQEEENKKKLNLKKIKIKTKKNQDRTKKTQVKPRKTK